MNEVLITQALGTIEITDGGKKFLLKKEPRFLSKQKLKLALMQNWKLK